MGVGAHGGEEAAGLAEHHREALALIASLREVAKAAGHAGPEPGPCEAVQSCNSLFGAPDLYKDGAKHRGALSLPSWRCMCATDSATVQPD